MHLTEQFDNMYEDRDDMGAAELGAAHDGKGSGAACGDSPDAATANDIWLKPFDPQNRARFGSGA